VFIQLHDRPLKSKGQMQCIKQLLMQSTPPHHHWLIHPCPSAPAHWTPNNFYPFQCQPTTCLTSINVLMKVHLPSIYRDGDSDNANNSTQAWVLLKQPVGLPEAAGHEFPSQPPLYSSSPYHHYYYKLPLWISTSTQLYPPADSQKLRGLQVVRGYDTAIQPCFCLLHWL
jgi:hypothetical protein